VTPRLRRRVFLAAAVVAGAFLLWGLTGLPDYGVYNGPYGDVLNRVAVAERKATNVVASVTFDYRGVDTMGEEYILFAAVLGVAILLRAQRDETEQPPDEDAADRHAPATSNAVRVVGLALVGPVVLFGIYVVAHGHLTPGGGFQGGVVLATGALLVYLSGEFVTLRRVSPEILTDAAESTGAAGYVAVGLLGLAAGATFLENVLPLGQPGQLLSAGTIPLLNLVVGVEVAGGFVLLLYEFLEQTLVIRRPGEVT
jgi:multicomponent Na+:H+ antiporter subunit B